MGDFPNKETQFQPGESGNKDGRPKGVRHSSTIIREFLEKEIDWQDIEGKPKKMQVIDAMILAQMKKAFKDGDVRSFQELLDRCEGKVPQKQQISGDPENPHGVTINVNRPKTESD